MHCIDDRIRTLPDILLSEKFGVGFESASTDTKVVIKTKPNVRRQTNSRSDNQTNSRPKQRVLNTQFDQIMIPFEAFEACG